MREKIVQVRYNRIQPSTFRVGHILVGSDGEQYQILDAENDVVVLRVLPPDERNKSEYMHGSVLI